MVESNLAVGSIIFRRSGHPVEIIGETKVSWIVGGKYPWDQQKLKKSAMRKGNSGEYWIQFFVDQQDALDCTYASHNAHKIGEAVGNCRDGKLLTKIAELVGYVPKEEA